jgi:cold shock CspA family protein
MSATDNNDNTTTPVGPADPVSRLTGRVKWFNNKTGFGFITALTDSEGVKEGSDVFVHHSAIKVAQEQYRYLSQGEYLEFVLSKLTASGAAESKHEFQAVDVSGIKGGKLICETRWEAKASGSGTGSGFSGSSGASRFNRSNEASSEWTTVGGPRKSSSFVPRQGSSEWRRGESSGRGRGRGGRGGAASTGPASSE